MAGRNAVMDHSELIGRLWARFEPELAEQGYELVELEIEGDGGGRVLRFYIDGPAGVTLDDCAAASELVSPMLDAEDVIRGRYMLEVSSPGIDRPIRKPADFERFTGEPVRVLAQEPVNGRRRFKGLLGGLRDGLVEVDCGDAVHRIHLENVKRVRLDR